MYQPNYGYQYPYYGTQPPMADNLAQLRMNQNPGISQPMPSQAQPTNSLIWVQGEAGAKSYLVAPNATVMLMDSEGDRFYLKSADASGMPLPLRVFEYKEVGNAPRSDFNAAANDFSSFGDKFVTREEFEQLKASIAPQNATNKTKNNLTEDAENA
jgi:hypothetical protein